MTTPAQPQDQFRSPLYSSFSVQNFRVLRDVRVERIKRVNLIAGENNVGKTALLESIFLHSGCFNPTLVLTVATIRGVQSYKFEFGTPVQPPWSSLFRDLDYANRIVFTGHDVSNRTRIVVIETTSDPRDLDLVRQNTQMPGMDMGLPSASGTLSLRSDVLKWHYSGTGREDSVLLFFDNGAPKTVPSVLRAPLYPARLLSAHWNPAFKEMAEQFGELEVEKREAALVDILRIIEPRLVRLAIVLLGQTPMLHADIGIGKLIPLAFLGDGMLRLAKYVLQMMHTPNGVLLIDEVENGFHYSRLAAIWDALAATAKLCNVQVFATTHSLECIRAAHKTFSNTFDYDFSLHRLEKRGEGVVAVTYDRESLEAALETGFEVR